MTDLLLGDVTLRIKAEEQSRWLTTELHRMSAGFTALKREHEAVLAENAHLKAAGKLACSDREMVERLKAAGEAG